MISLNLQKSGAEILQSVNLIYSVIQREEVLESPVVLASFSAFEKISQSYSTVVFQESVLPALHDLLQTPSGQSNVMKVALVRKISMIPAIFEMFMAFVLSRFEDTSRSTFLINEEVMLLVTNIVKEISESIFFAENRKTVSLQLLAFINSIFSKTGIVSTATESTYVSAIIGSVVRALDESSQTEAVAMAHSHLFVLPALNRAPGERTRGIIFSGVISNLKPTVSLPFDALEYLAHARGYLEVNAPHDDYALSIIFTASTIVNRAAKKGSNLLEHLSACGWKDNSTFFSRSPDGSHIMMLSRVWGLDLLEALVDTLENTSDLASTITELFPVLIQENPSKWAYVLTKESFGVGSPFWKQKIFARVFPILMRCERDYRADVKK
ncbi:hypothetical protein HDU67_003926, partial [Dinochytrium kinnereticum]